MSSRHFGLIPAAGSGARFAAGTSSAEVDLPKQYRHLKGHAGGVGQSEDQARCMLEHSVRALLAGPEIDIVFVVLAPMDSHFRGIDWADQGPRVEPLYCGGASRRDSVLNGLVAISTAVEPDDWVLVHDAARPCLGKAELERLLRSGEDAGSAGGILAVPVADTLKRGDAEAQILGTEPRDGLWHAQTPQMFRHALLMRALLQAPDVTDEAGAVERLGLRPKLVLGSPMNIKVTVREDLELAELILARR